MNRAVLSLIGFTLFTLASNSQAVIYDFAAEGNTHEAGYDPAFVSGDHNDPNPAHSGGYQMPDGLTITASNGLGLPTNPFDIMGTEATYFAYMDANTSASNPSRNAGLGVCREADADCAGISDDNHMFGEYIHMAFDSIVKILTLDITGNHVAVEDDTFFHYSLDDGSSWESFSIAGQLTGSPDTILTLTALGTAPAAFWTTSSLIYTVSGPGEMYLSAMEVSAVPVPAAFWLFGTALFGFIAVSRRTKV